MANPISEGLEEILSKAYLVPEAFDLVEGLLSTIDPGEIKARLENDGKKIQIFFRVVVSKVLNEATAIMALVASEDLQEAKARANNLKDFVQDANLVAAVLTSTAQNISKVQFPKDLFNGKYSDPFKGTRNAVRDFAKKYDLKDLAAAMG